MAKRLTLQIDKQCFKDILNGCQHIEHRFIYPSNANRYVIQRETDDGLGVQCIQYDELYLINGRRKEAPRLTIHVERADFVVFCDEDGKEQTTVNENGEEYLVCQAWYHLGKVTSTENVPDDYYYDAETKKERLHILTEMESQMDEDFLY